MRQVFTLGELSKAKQCARNKGATIKIGILYRSSVTSRSCSYSFKNN
ncbi:hypothetical protein M23134_04651 [Microscilla marina ATCC 23134]|uniref:Uncharacterized protein n=1 Tax=Microscilla marina ATCC 23134 TaxID=313606 RepID=A1ZTF1_MICM2|nr:hypothetical protein M23134_04651 [Microscilla marina ATCC 23134]